MQGSTVGQSISPAALKVQKVGLPISLAAAAATSFHSQMELAHLIGWGYHLAWLLPTAVVVWEVVNTSKWFGVPDAEEWKEVKRRIRKQALLAVGTSALLNALWHVNDPAAGAPLAITLLVSAIPNVVTFSLLHGAMGDHTPSSSAPEPVLPPEPVVEQGAEVPLEQVRQEAEVPQRKVNVGAGKALMEERKQQCRDYLEAVEGVGMNVEKVSGADLQRKYGLSDRQWRYILAEVRKERPADGWKRQPTAA